LDAALDPVLADPLDFAPGRKRDGRNDALEGCRSPKIELKDFEILVFLQTNLFQVPRLQRSPV
jgi:hypothetical protein